MKVNRLINHWVFPKNFIYSFSKEDKFTYSVPTLQRKAKNWIYSIFLFIYLFLIVYLKLSEICKIINFNNDFFLLLCHYSTKNSRMKYRIKFILVLVCIFKKIDLLDFLGFLALKLPDQKCKKILFLDDMCKISHVLMKKTYTNKPVSRNKFWIVYYTTAFDSLIPPTSEKASDRVLPKMSLFSSILIKIKIKQ